MYIPWSGPYIMATTNKVSIIFDLKFPWRFLKATETVSFTSDTRSKQDTGLGWKGKKTIKES